MVEWVTQREAARLLGVHVSAVPKMVRRGDLTPRAGRPSLSRDEVLDLVEARSAAAQERKGRRAETPTGPRPPDDEHEWLLAPEAGVLMGVGPEAVKIRARRGRLPSEVHDGRRWFRRDHLELVRRADESKRRRTLLASRTTAP